MSFLILLSLFLLLLLFPKVDWLLFSKVLGAIFVYADDQNMYNTELQ